MNHGEAWVRVWDPFVRIFHWLLVATFLVAYLTDDDLMSLHAWAGYTMGVLIVLRVGWGFAGPKHARFSDFLYRPAEIAAYLRDLFAFKGTRYLGHTPAGGAMVVILLAGLAVTIWTGMESLASERGEGPLAQSVRALLPDAVRADDEKGEHDERRNGGTGEFWEDVHEAVANLMLVLVIVHICGVLLASFVHRENLAGAMLTGRKREEPGGTWRE